MKTPQLNRIDSLIAICLLVIAVLGCANTSTPENKAAPAAAPSGSPVSSPAAGATAASSPATALKVSSSDLTKAYDANEVSADDKYKGKTLAVSGTVGSIAKDFMGNMYVTLKGFDQYGVHSSFCYLDDAHKAAVSNLKQGQKVTFQCRGDGVILGNVILKDCTPQ